VAQAIFAQADCAILHIVCPFYRLVI